MTKDESKILTDPYTLNMQRTVMWVRALKQPKHHEEGMSHSTGGTCPGAPRLLLSAYSCREAYRQTSQDSCALCYVCTPSFRKAVDSVELKPCLPSFHINCLCEDLFSKVTVWGTRGQDFNTSLLGGDIGSLTAPWVLDFYSPWQWGVEEADVFFLLHSAIQVLTWFLFVFSYCFFTCLNRRKQWKEAGKIQKDYSGRWRIFLWKSFLF